MTPDTLRAAMPGLSPALAARYQPYNDAAMDEFGIDTPARAWMWLAQTGHESLSLRYFEEIASGTAYEGRKDLGNTRRGDGRKFKGRGPIQITGRYNYTKAAEALGVPLVDSPQLAAQPHVAFRISAWWWREHGLNGPADTGDVTRVTRVINGGTRGLPDRQSRYKRCKALGTAALPARDGKQPPTPPAAKAPAFPVDYISTSHNATAPAVLTWQQQMAARGWAIDADGHYGPRSERACRALQSQHGLGTDGVVGPVTWAATWERPVQ